MTRRLHLAAYGLAMAGLLSACGSGMGGGRGGRPDGGPPGQGGPRAYADPSAIVATDLAFARMAKEKGQWSAFTEYAAENAVLFEPQPVDANGWLKNRTAPAAAMEWQPYSIWMSCDGSLAISQGAWRGSDGTHGWYTTAWERQEKGGYRWTMNQRGKSSAPMPPPEMLDAHVASCKPRGKIAPPPPEPATGLTRTGISRDRTLEWDMRGSSQCGLLTATMWRGPDEGQQEVLHFPMPSDQSEEPGQPCDS